MIYAFAPSKTRGTGTMSIKTVAIIFFLCTPSAGTRASRH